MKQKLWKNCLEPCLLGIASIGGFIAGSWFIMQNPVRNCMILTLVLLAVAKIYRSGDSTLIQQTSSGVDDEGYREVWQKRKVKVR